MKVRGSRLFPYPVLWYLNDDYDNSENITISDFSVDIEHKQQFQKLIINYDIKINDEGLLDLIDDGKATYCIHIENSLTSFRRSYLSADKKGNIEIDENDINHEIEISIFVIALEEVVNYHNKNLNEDYHGAEINLPKGSMLAVGDYVKITIDKSQNELGKKDSILTISKKFDIDTMEIEIENDRIIIYLNERDFTNLQFLQSSSDYKGVIYSIVIVPTLIYVFDSIAQSDSEELLEYVDYKWYRSLDRMFESNGLDLSPQTIRNKTSYELAQNIIGKPISKALVFLNERGE